MYENIFNRIEEKYLLNKEQYLLLFKGINRFITKDEFYQTTICNLYFDNNNHDLIINSLEKPVYKHKVRLRSYGVPKLTDDVFLEVKSKYKKVVGKRRIKLTLQEFNTYFNKRIFDYNNQIMKEIDYLFKLYELKPRYFIAYDRKSYCGKENQNLRITFDTNLRSRKDNLALNIGDHGKLYFNQETYIMEIKTLGTLPLWLVKELSKLKIYPVSFSKYGSIYKKDQEELKC